MRLFQFISVSFFLLLQNTVSSQVDSLGVDSLQSIPDTLVYAAMDTTKADSIVQYARKFIGKPYVYGSTTGKSFDCSGYTQHVFSNFEVKLPHSSSAQFTECNEIKMSEVRKGDLLFFSGRKAGSKTIGHVSLVTEVQGDRIKMIHATTHGGVMEEWINDSKYFKPKLLHAGRLKQMPQPSSEIKKAKETEKPKKKSKKKKRRK